MPIRSFPPLATPAARVLILGSMPGEESLRRRQYYAHRHNQFWRIMGALFGAPPTLPYRARVRRLTARGVAVWDVLRECERAGSLDASIERDSEVANDFARFLRRHPRIRAVFFNGGKAQQAFRRHVQPLLGEALAGVELVRLPSTSPAHAGLDYDAKLAAWRRVLRHVK